MWFDLAWFFRINKRSRFLQRIMVLRRNGNILHFYALQSVDSFFTISVGLSVLSKVELMGESCHRNCRWREKLNRGRSLQTPLTKFRIHRLKQFPNWNSHWLLIGSKEWKRNRSKRIEFVVISGNLFHPRLSYRKFTRPLVRPRNASANIKLVTRCCGDALMC